MQSCQMQLTHHVAVKHAQRNFLVPDAIGGLIVEHAEWVTHREGAFQEEDQASRERRALTQDCQRIFPRHIAGIHRHLQHLDASHPILTYISITIAPQDYSTALVQCCKTPCMSAAIVSLLVSTRHHQCRAARIRAGLQQSYYSIRNTPHQRVRPASLQQSRHPRPRNNRGEHGKSLWLRECVR